MNKIYAFLCLIFFLATQNSLNSQSYCCTSAIVWTEATFTPFDTYTSRHTFNEFPFELHGHLYYEVLQSLTETGDDWTPTGNFLRYEDQKIYYANTIEEFVIMDFSLDEGEQISLPLGGAEYTVVAVDTTTLENGDLQRQLTLNCEAWGPTPIYWIDEIGSSAGIENWYSTCAFDIGHQMLCMWRNDTLIYDNPAYDGCWLETVSTVDLTSYKIEYNPNPVSTHLFIGDPEDHILKINITNSVGERVYQGKENAISMEAFSSGIYIVRFQLKDGKTGSAKIVKL